MVRRTHELFSITDCSSEYGSFEAEYFETLSEAESHISDKDKNNRFVYHGFYTDRQECEIKRWLITPEMKTLEVADVWRYRDGRLVSHEEGPYG